MIAAKHYKQASTDTYVMCRKGDKMLKCPCKECIKVTKKGVKEMKEEGASQFAINDYAYEMLTGLWIGCENCKYNDSNNFITEGTQNVREVDGT